MQGQNLIKITRARPAPCSSPPAPVPGMASQCDHLLPGTREAPLGGGGGGGGWGLALLCTESSIAACQGPENTIK